MTRASGIILQVLVIAIFASAMFFFSLAVSHACAPPFTIQHIIDDAGDEIDEL